jgi:MFS transporter, ACS family, tartrate transporter
MAGPAGVGVPARVGAAGAGLTAYAQSPLLLVVAITPAAVGILSAIPVFWALPTAFLSGTAAAADIALIAAVGNLAVSWARRSRA